MEAGPILFISDKSATNQLYSMNEDGSNVQQLTSDSAFPILDAKWSPDGSKIAVVSLIGDEMTYPSFRDAIFIMNADGSDRYELTQQWLFVDDSIYGRIQYGGARNPVWSPDSRQIAYSRLLVPEALAHYDIFVIRADGTKEERVTRDMSLSEIVTDWSPDSGFLAGFASDYKTLDSSGYLIENTRIVIVDLSGNIHKSLGQLGTTYSWPMWSHSGVEILFNSNDKNTQDIYIVDSSGDNKTKLTNGTYQFTFPVSWSPDDAEIIFNAGNGDSLGRPFGKLFLVNVQEKNVKEITPFEGSIYSYATSWRRR